MAAQVRTQAVFCGLNTAMSERNVQITVKVILGLESRYDIKFSLLKMLRLDLKHLRLCLSNMEALENCV